MMLHYTRVLTPPPVPPCCPPAGQKEINLAADLDAGTRGEIYKNYLMYTMSGDVVELPVGGTIRKKTNMAARQQEMARLSQLGDLLGMTNLEINQVHQVGGGEALRCLWWC